jgi:ubiquinone biosynthesis protein COQ9
MNSLKRQIPRQSRLIQSQKNLSCKAQCSRFHSYDHPSAPPYTATAQSILQAALQHVPISGFSTTSLRKGAQDVGYLSTSTNLFPQGAFDLVSYYLATRRLALQDLVHDAENGYTKTWVEAKTGVGSRVRTLLLERLNMNVEAGVVPKWPEVSLFVIRLITHSIGFGLDGATLTCSSIGL